jgi:hypothetical protein
MTERMSEWKECDEQYAEMFLAIITVLRETYTTLGVAAWLRSRNRDLDLARPIDLINAGQGSRVLEIAQGIER